MGGAPADASVKAGNTRGVFGGDMPALGGGGAAQSNLTPLDKAFNHIMEVMPELEKYNLLLRALTEVQLKSLPQEDITVLQNGDTLQERFMRMQQKAVVMSQGAGQAPDAAMVAESIAFDADLTKHTANVKAVCEKLNLKPALLEDVNHGQAQRDVPKLVPRGDL